MSAAPEISRAATASGAMARPPAAVAGADAPRLAHRLAVRLGNEWLPRVAWTVNRTGRPGLVGIALLLTAAMFYFSTHLKVAAEVEALRSDLVSARVQARRPAPEKGADPASALRALPGPTDMPAILRQIFSEATRARLAVDTGKYEIKATRSSGVVRYHVAFPVTGPYPQIRSFIDATLATMPAVGLSDLTFERKAIADGEVEAQVRMTVYTAAPGAFGSPEAGPTTAVAAGGPASPGNSEARAGIRSEAGLKGRTESERVVPPAHASALFAQHSWTVLPPLRVVPPPPVVEPPPPPPPAAPPLPYTFVGSFAPVGDAPVYFLAHGDRMFDAHVGDRIEGVYQFESVAGGQLVFVYLPLNIRQNLAAGVSN
jgi:Tfp pilus assembly protein PilO